MPPIAKASELRAPKKILLITKLTWGTMMAKAMGNEMANICLLETVTCRDGLLLLPLISANLQLVFTMNCPFFYNIA